MAEKKTRERAEWNGQIVTVLERGLRKTTIRDSFGYRREVPRNQVKSLDDKDERKTFSYEEPSAIVR